jgi:hypothetical protein
MIIRLSNTLSKKIKETDLALLPPDPNPFADWSARLFTADRAQYILMTNSASLYSVVIYGRGVTDGNAFLHEVTDMMRDVMEKDGFRLIYKKRVAPQTARVSFSKAVNRSVTGSMNEFAFYAKWHLIRDEMSPYDVSFQLNKTPMSYIKYRYPRDAFQSMGQEAQGYQPRG